MRSWMFEHFGGRLHNFSAYRRHQLQQVAKELDDIALYEKINCPAQIQRVHIHNYYKRHNKKSRTELEQSYQRFVLLFKMLGFSTVPPRPPHMFSFNLSKKYKKL